MTKKEAIKIFEEKKVRTVWDDETEEWYFSIVDVVGVLTDEWKRHGLQEGVQFATLTDIIYKTWLGNTSVII